MIRYLPTAVLRRTNTKHAQACYFYVRNDI
nr:MAG TPA: hypothetical protein [Caudoviricetes sp.]